MQLLRTGMMQVEVCQIVPWRWSRDVDYRTLCNEIVGGSVSLCGAKPRASVWYLMIKLTNTECNCPRETKLSSWDWDTIIITAVISDADGRDDDADDNWREL